MRRNRHLVILLLPILVSACGCQRATTVVGAVVCQGIRGPTKPVASGPWRFAGLDPRRPPRIRPGSYATATYGVRFLDPETLGRHGYCLDWSERNGIVYTCRAGHIDIAHVRKAADWTGYLAATTFECLAKGRTRFRFRLREPSVYTVVLTPPADWEGLDDAKRERIARDVSRRLGQHLAYTALTWHEILTWFGYRPKAYESDFPSAFSWEDNYSNLLGVLIAADALEDQSCAFSEAVTAGLAMRLQELGVQSADAAGRAAEAVRGQWYSSEWGFTVMHERNFDVGLDDGYVEPSLVPSLTVCVGASPLPLAVPTLDALAAHGFSVQIEIEPKVWEQNKIWNALRAAGGMPAQRIDPAVDFPLLMSRIEGLAACHGSQREPRQLSSTRRSP